MSDHNRLVEGEGVYAIGFTAHKLGLLFRQVKEHDKGIDAEIELTQTVNAISPIIGLQIKARSRFKVLRDKKISIRVSEQNLRYWKNYGRPVILIAYSHEGAYWTRVDNTTSRNIIVDYTSIFDESTIKFLVEILSDYYSSHNAKALDYFDIHHSIGHNTSTEIYAGYERNKHPFINLDSLDDIKNILTFAEKYCQQVELRHSYIIPPNFDKALRIPIDDLYVTPGLIVNNNKSEGEKYIDYASFTSCIHRTIILGQPGGGKSTLALKLCHDLATLAQKGMRKGKFIPILVTLRDYSDRKKKVGCSIVEFIQGQANADYQLQPPSHAFEYLFFNTSIVVIFDGLDELLDSRQRQHIVSDINLFAVFMRAHQYSLPHEK